jgi:hypothetical protein
VSAPTSLSVGVAQACGITLAAFVRDGHANLYSAPERILETPAAAPQPPRDLGAAVASGGG